MKRFLTRHLLPVLIFSGALSFAELVAPAFNISGDAAGIDIIPAGICSGGRYEFQTWGPEEKRKRSASIYLEMTSNAWANAWFSFKPSKDGAVNISLYGSYKIVDGANKRINVLFDNVEAEGTALKNGNFEEGKDGMPAAWYAYAKDGTVEGGPRYLAKRGVNGSSCIMTWHNGSFSQTIKCKKDETVTIRLNCKLADADDEAAPAPGAAVKPDNSKYKDIPDTAVDLIPAANMDFTDDKAGDGIGGWSDQGSENDLSGFDTARTDYRGIDFSIIDPKKNGGKAVLTFRSENVKTSLERITLPVGGAKARFLYLLHTACFVTKQKETLARIIIRTKSGRETEHEVVTGKDIADWWGAGHLANGLVAYRKSNKTSSVGLYLSRFAVGDDLEEVESVTLATAGTAVWIVVGATLSAKEIDLVPQKFTVKSGEGWKPIDMTSVVVEPKSALDLSGLVEDGPAGKHGRVIVNANGQMAFADSPNVPIRFIAFNTFVNHVFGYPETKLASSDKAQVKANCERYAAQIRRQGYNMVRFQGVDILLMPGTKDDFEINQGNLDHLCYLIHCLKREGVYVNIDLWSYNGYLKGEWDEALKRGLAELMLVDTASRTLWETGVKLLMAHKNPYTGTTFAEEKAIALVTMFNEQDIPVILNVFNGSKVKPFAAERWREYLQKRYSDIAEIERAWGKPFPSGTAIETIALFPKGSEWQRTAYGTDVGRFMYDRLRDLLIWYQTTLRSTGYTGLSGQYDVIKYYRDHAARNESPVIAMHTYHNHPTDMSMGKGSRMGQDGIIQSSANYWRTQAAARYLNRPMCITEYNTMYWHRYRHEEGILFPAYSALQDFSVITVHAQAVILQAVTPLASGFIGRDPIGRAGEVMAAFLYGRRDVSPSKHTVALAMNDAYIFTNGNMNYAVNSDQSKIALMCRFGLQYDAPTTAALPPYPKADMTVTPADGAAIVASQWAASVIDNAGGGDLDAVVESMKTKGILSKDNLSSPAQGIFQSDTKEINMNSPEEQLTVVTPRMECVILKEKKAASLNAVKTVRTTVAAAIGVASLDGKTVAESKRLLIVYSTDALNTGFEASDDRVTLVNNGKLPVLMQTGTLKAAVGTKHGAGMTLWALGLDGTRKEKIPLTRVTDDEVRITIDTDTLKNGPTPFFELAAQ
ncbi:MAG: hypothetical protein AABZ39_20935 [Spirochaetota bacterium]